MNEEAILKTEGDEDQSTDGTGFFIKRIAFFALGALLFLLSAVSSILVLRPVAAPVELDALDSPALVEEGKVYRISALKVSGIFMYEGDAKQKGVPRNSGEGIFLEKEHVRAYHTLALTEGEGDEKVYVFTFSVDESHGEAFDLVAAHDKEENLSMDTGESFTLSAYVKVKGLEEDYSAALEQSKQKTSDLEGAEKLEWVFYELEYCADGDADYVTIANAAKRKWLRLTFAPVPFGVLCIALSFIEPRKCPCRCGEEQKTQDDQTDDI